MSGSISASLPEPVQRGPRLTRRGWGVVAMVVLLVGIGMWVHEVALVHLGLALGALLGAAWWMARGNLKGIRVERAVPGSAFVGEWIPVSLRLIGPDRRDGIWAVEMADELMGSMGEGVAARVLRPGEVREYGGQTRLRKRGLNPVFRWKMMSTFPAGVWRVSRAGWYAAPITVFPRPVTPADLDEPRAIQDDEDGDVWQPKPDWGGDFLGIREFQPGDPLKHVHWQASARAQKWVVREYDQRLPTSHALFFHSWQPEGGRRLPDAFEAALELLTGLVMRCTGDSVPVTLAADFNGWRTHRLNGGQALGDVLALLASAKWVPTHDLSPLHECLRAVPAESHVYIVSDTPVRHWQSLVPVPAHMTVTCLSVGELRRRHAFRLPLTSASQRPASLP